MTLQEAPMGGCLTQALDEAESVVHSDPAAAESLLHTTRTEAIAQAMPEVAGRASYLLARVLAERGEYDAALGLIADARESFARAGRGLMAARTSLGRMHILDDLGRHGEALEAGESLLHALAGVVPDGDDERELKAMLEAAAMGNCGIALGFLGEHARSLDAFERAEAGYAALGMTDEVAMWQANRGIELISLGQTREAGVALSAAADAFRAGADPLWEAKCWTYLAEARRLTSDVVGALALLAEAHDVLEALGATAELVRVHLQRGRVYLDAGLGREAAAAAQAAVDLAAGAGMAGDEAQGHLIGALAALAADSLEQAEEDLARAESLFQLVGNAQFQARSRVARGELLVRRGERAEAAALLRATVTELRAGGWLIPAGWGLLSAYDAEEAPGARASLLDDAVRLAGDLSLPGLDVAVQYRRASQLAAAGDRVEAATRLRAARARIAQLGAAYREPSLMTAFHASKRDVSDDLVHLLALDGTPSAVSEALSVSDDAKAQSLSDLVAGTLGDRASDAPLQQMRAELSGVYAALHDVADASRRDVLRGRADALEAAIVDAHVRWSVTVDEAPADVVRSAHVAPTPNRAPGIAFHVVGDDVIAFVVEGEGVTCRVLAGAYPDVSRLTSSLSAQWGRVEAAGPALDRLQAPLIRSTRALLIELYDVLLAPLADDLDRLDGDRLVIAPDRLLHRVPFHALFDGERYVIDRWSITLSPTTLPSSVPAAVPAATTSRPVVVGVADERAPGIGTEARRVAAALPGALLLLGEQATVAAVTAAAPGASLLHLACHGMFRSENALFSSLRLADRWWTCSEVVDLDLSGATVVLTACESGRSGDTAEPIGLAWGFLATGATSAVVSQWVLDDQASTELMTTFYDRLRSGADVESALRTAQLAVREHRPHPYFWGPLVHVASPFGSTALD